MSGIVRIHIESEWNDRRTRMSRDLEPTADEVYRKSFENLSMPLEKDAELVTCTKDEAMARYDWKEGIDCLLYFKNGTKATLQEKFLDWVKSTATFEERKVSGQLGAWYYCTAQYYFVAYARLYKNDKNLSFQDWIMIDLPGLHRKDAAIKLPWKFQPPEDPTRGGPFRFLYFDQLPKEVIVDRYKCPPFEMTPSNPNVINWPRPGQEYKPLWAEDVLQKMIAQANKNHKHSDSKQLDRWQADLDWYERARKGYADTSNNNVKDVNNVKDR